MNREQEALIKILKFLDLEEAQDGHCPWCDRLIRKIREIINESPK